MTAIDGAPPEQKRPRGRPVDPAIDDQVLAATRELLVEQGFDRLTMDEVARRCGVSKATIYRRWPSKTALAVAAASQVLIRTEVPDTGDLRQDLLECGRAYLQHDARGAQVSAALLVASRVDPELREAAQRVLGDPHTELLRSVIHRAVDRGDVADTIDAETVVEVLPSIACQRAVARGLPLHDADIVRIVDAVLMPALSGR